MQPLKGTVARDFLIVFVSWIFCYGRIYLPKYIHQRCGRQRQVYTKHLANIQRCLTDTANAPLLIPMLHRWQHHRYRSYHINITILGLPMYWPLNIVIVVIPTSPALLTYCCRYSQCRYDFATTFHSAVLQGHTKHSNICNRQKCSPYRILALTGSASAHIQTLIPDVADKFLARNGGKTDFMVFWATTA